MKITLGANKLTDDDDETVFYQAEKFIPHPEFKTDSSGMHNDIALIKLSTTVQYMTGTDGFTINSICIPSGHYKNDSGVTWLSGFGLDKLQASKDSLPTPFLREG